MTTKHGPKDHREAMALFRAGIVGGLVHRQLDHGELKAALAALAQQRFRPPGRDMARRYAVSTLERWFYGYRDGGMVALTDSPRSDRGFIQALTDEQRVLLMEIRREFPSAASALIIRTLVNLGRLAEGAITASSLNRFYAAQGLPRAHADHSGRPQRLRWVADAAHALWHADVCHGSDLRVDGNRAPVRIHGILDDHSRDLIMLEARATEREDDMLDLLMKALLRTGRPKALFLDNGATYRGKALALVCERLGTTLIHARPHQPQGRGKMERFWRTLREQCLDYIPPTATLQDVNAHLAVFWTRYRATPHAGLMGDTPLRVAARGEAQQVTEEVLRAAFTVTAQRRVLGDSTLSIHGTLYQVGEHMLAGKRVQVEVSLLDGKPASHVTYAGHRYVLSPVDPIANGLTRRTRSPASEAKKTGFDPNKARRNEIVEAIRRAQDDEDQDS
jgi:putative transposase